jgi:hypothetical protein
VLPLRYSSSIFERSGTLCARNVVANARTFKDGKSNNHATIEILLFDNQTVQDFVPRIVIEIRLNLVYLLYAVLNVGINLSQLRSGVMCPRVYKPPQCC